MKKPFVLIGLLFFSAIVFSQSFDCETILSYRQATPPFKVSELSKGLQCTTNNKYEYSITLKPGNEYRISFYASSILNNKMWFQIVDAGTGKKLMDLPGETAENKMGESVLKEYYDYRTEKYVYPYFEFIPKEEQKLKIIIDIPEYKEKIKIKEKNEDFNQEEEWMEYIEKRKGCVSIFIQETKADQL